MKVDLVPKLGKRNTRRTKRNMRRRISKIAVQTHPSKPSAPDKKIVHKPSPREVGRQTFGRPIDAPAFGPSGAWHHLNQFAFDHAAELMMWIDGQGTCALGNDAALEALGYTHAEFVGMKIWDIDPAMDANKWERFLKKLNRIGRTRVDSLFSNKSGQERPFETVATTVKLDGRVFALICARDTSERQFAEGLRVLYAKELERQIAERDRTAGILRESEERVRLLLDSTAEAIYAKDSDGNCALCNPACARLLGIHHPSELIGRNMHALMHHSREDGTPYPIEECPVHLSLQSGRALHGESEVFWRRDGTSFPAEYWCYPMARDGKNMGAVVTFFDVTERRRSEEQIRRLAAIVESSDDAIVGKDLEGFVTTWNAGAENMYGYTPLEAVGQHIGFLAVPGQEPAFEDVLST